MEQVFYKHPTQGFIKTIKKDSKNVIAQLENQGWFQCTSYNDPTPFKEVVKKTKKSKKKK